jgi:hypothetical protein
MTDTRHEQVTGDHEHILNEARQVVQDAVVSFRGRPVGTHAACDPRFAGTFNYHECFVRDFVPSALVFLTDDEPEIVRNFLEAVDQVCSQEQRMKGHDLHAGVMPASFRVEREDGDERLQADFGNRAIGRVAPVDSMMWWAVLLLIYQRATGDTDLAQKPEFQRRIELSLDLGLKASFEVFPTLLVPDGSCMIDRRMGVYGHPLEIQALFSALLDVGRTLLEPTDGNRALRDRAAQRREALRSYVRERYWLDRPRLTEIHRFRTEEFGSTSINALNIHPDSMPEWVTDWLPAGGGYLVGNLGPGRMDFRFFALGNLLAVLFALATEDQSTGLFHLYDARWEDLAGEVPLRLVFPAVENDEWRVLTGSDPRNWPWTYHNGGSWPTLLWPFVAAALRAGRRDLAERAFALVASRAAADGWPEYYDGRNGRLVGRFANLRQVWTAAALIVGHRLLHHPELSSWLEIDSPTRRSDGDESADSAS